MSLVPKEGLEPSHPERYRILNPTRLPIPPLRRLNPHTGVRGVIHTDSKLSRPSALIPRDFCQVEDAEIIKGNGCFPICESKRGT